MLGSFSLLKIIIISSRSIEKDDRENAGEKIDPPVEVNECVSAADRPAAGESAGRSCAQVAFKCLTSPKLLPINEGSFRALKIVLPPGKVVSAQKPAAVRWWMTIPMTIVDTVFRALAPAIPDHTIAAHHADIVVPYMYGTDHRTGRFFIDPMFGVPGGGWGATSKHDGMSATICINDGDTHNTPVEAGEVRVPYITEYYRLRRDSGGPGKYRGGMGAELSRRMQAPGFFNSQIERTVFPPWGIEGGGDAMPNEIKVRRADGTMEEYPNGKLDSIQLTPEDAVIISAGGGGGFGDPTERDVDAVKLDVIRGYVSVEKARDAYGVVLDSTSHEVDRASTESLRAERRTQRT